MKYFVIVNPISGRGLGEKSIPRIESALKEFGFNYTLVRTDTALEDALRRFLVRQPAAGSGS